MHEQPYRRASEPPLMKCPASGRPLPNSRIKQHGFGCGVVVGGEGEVSESQFVGQPPSTDSALRPQRPGRLMGASATSGVCAFYKQGSGGIPRCRVEQGQEVPPNPSFKRTRNGMALCPRSAVGYPAPRGHSAMPLRAA
jgi:hypothetical protein